MWRLYRFTWMQNHRLASRLMTRYLGRPYAFFLDHNTAELGKNILQEASQVVTGVMVPGIQLVAKVLIALFIVGFLVVVEPLLALLVMGILGGAYLAIFTLFRRRLAKLSQERVDVLRDRFQTISESFGGVKDVKVLGAERFFTRQFFGPSKRFSEILVNEAVISYLPKYVLEIVAFGSIILIVLYLLVVEGNVDYVLPIVGVYAFAGYRLMPALQQIFESVTKIKLSLANLDILYRDLVGPSEAPSALEAEHKVEHEVEHTVWSTRWRLWRVVTSFGFKA